MMLYLALTLSTLAVLVVVRLIRNRQVYLNGVLLAPGLDYELGCGVDIGFGEARFAFALAPRDRIQVIALGGLIRSTRDFDSPVPAALP